MKIKIVNNSKENIYPPALPSNCYARAAPGTTAGVELCFSWAALHLLLQGVAGTTVGVEPLFVVLFLWREPLLQEGARAFWVEGALPTEIFMALRNWQMAPWPWNAPQRLIKLFKHLERLY